MPYYNRDPEKDHNFDNHPYRNIVKNDINIVINPSPKHKNTAELGREESGAGDPATHFLRCKDQVTNEYENTFFHFPRSKNESLLGESMDKLFGPATLGCCAMHIQDSYQKHAASTPVRTPKAGRR